MDELDRLLHCPTCDRTNADEDSVNCSNCWHLTYENRIPTGRQDDGYRHHERNG